jgi:ubiquitin-activating enzyme E1
MQEAKVLIVGLCGLHVEVVKNLVLSGVNVTIQDPKDVALNDLSSNYFVSEADVGKNVSA